MEADAGLQLVQSPLPSIVGDPPSAAAAFNTCTIDLSPADRLVRRCVFLPASADAVNPLGGPASPQDRTRLARILASAFGAPAAQATQGALEEALRAARNNVALAYALGVAGAVVGNQAAAGGWALLSQDLGYLFLDQIRFRPAGAVLGDLVYTLGLAPREKVTLTQKAWSKRQMSLEDMVDQTQETTVEFDSAFSTEISENTDNQQQHQQSWNLNATVSGSYGGVVGGSVGYGTSASDASSQTQQTAAKQAQQTTRKVTDTAKQEHRITFKLETETGIEDVSQRVFENPNTCHSLMLNFYRVYQQIEASYERWGARACWAPCISDPGRDLRIQQEKITQQQQDYLNAVNSWMPPDMPPQPAAQSLQSQWSEEVKSGDFGYSDDVKTSITVPAGSQLVSITWERDPNQTWGTVDWPRKHLNPNPGDIGQLDVWWHVGLADCNIIQGCPEPWAKIRTDFTVAPTSAALQTWTQQLQQERAAEYQRRLAQVQAEQAQTGGTNIPPYDPFAELMRRVVADKLTPDRYGSCTEVYLWHAVFEWEAASYQLYPPWWNGLAPDAQQSEPTDFLNASWARLYVPIRPGQEAVAFLLMYGKAGKDPSVASFIADLDDYRSKSFGAPGKETVIRVAAWQEMMPTDGTYVEPVLGKCGACDDELTADQTAARKLIEAQATALEQAGQPGKQS